MKFQQRLLILGAVSISLVVFLVLLGSIQMLGLLQPYKSHHISYRSSPYRDTDYGMHFQSVQQSLCSGLENLKPTANLTTIDLKQITTYKMRSDGEYVLPTADTVVDYKQQSVEPLTVIVVPHSHNDPGWLRTVDDYYVTQTKNILNNMLNKLRIYPNMTFVWAESVFLSMWWNELEDDVKMQVRRLIRKGQLEIVLGGWVMPDEASTHYYSIIDQLMEGHQWVLENLQTKPENSWSIDPFGHSGTIPYLWKQSGLENMVIQRIHQSTKATLAENKNLEFKWRQFWDTEGKSDILCHVMPYILYGIKHTCGPNDQICLMFDFRESDRWKPYTDSINVKNLKKRAALLYDQYRSKASLYRYNTILVPLGDDFRYDQESEWDNQYQNYNMLMHYMNSKPEWNINIRFGTLKDYFEEMKKSMETIVSSVPGKSLNSLSGDFFPYSDKNRAYWSGYFTTRPFDKHFSREVESSLRAAEILNVLVVAYMKKWKLPLQTYHELAQQLQTARRNLGLFLHHDAITGTAKSYVVEDYERGLLEAYNGTQKVLKIAIQTLLSQGQLDKPLIVNTAVYRPNSYTTTMKTIIPVSASGTKVILFNPLIHNRTEIVSFYVNTDKFIIRDSKNAAIPHQLNPVWESAVSIHPYVVEVSFLKELAPLSLETVTLYKTDRLMSTEAFPAKITIYNIGGLDASPDLPFLIDKSRNAKKEMVSLENDFLLAKFDSKDGSLQSVLDKRTGNLTKTHLQFMVYKSRGSGAYLFFPAGPSTYMYPDNTRRWIHLIQGPIMSQIEVVTHEVHHVVQLFHHPGEQGRGLHIYNILNMNSGKNLEDNEVIMRFDTDIQNKDLTFHTDQNGYQLVTRRTDPRLRIEANYYPMTSMAVLEGSGTRLTLHSGQAHGVASLETGQLEVMLDRKLLYDDERGLGEGVLDNKITLSKFVLQLEPYEQPLGNSEKASGTTFPSLLAMTINHHLQQPVVGVFTHINTAVLSNVLKPTTNANIPCDVTLVSLKNLVSKDLVYTSTSLILHRHGYLCGFPTQGLQCHQSSNITINSLFKDLPVYGVRETTLTHLYEKRTLRSSSNLDLKPMDITAFQLKL